jgi:hypothetical protein
MSRVSWIISISRAAEKKCVDVVKIVERPKIHSFTSSLLWINITEQQQYPHGIHTYVDETL